MQTAFRNIYVHVVPRALFVFSIMYMHTFFKCPNDITHCATLFFYFIILCLDSIIYFYFFLSGFILYL